MVTLAINKEKYARLFDELAAISLPHGNMICIPGEYLRKLIMKRCESHQDMHSSRNYLEKRIPKVPMQRDAAMDEVKESIVWYWSLPVSKRAELEARYQGFT